MDIRLNYYAADGRYYIDPLQHLSDIRESVNDLDSVTPATLAFAICDLAKLLEVLVVHVEGES